MSPTTKAALSSRSDSAVLLPDLGEELDAPIIAKSSRDWPPASRADTMSRHQKADHMSDIRLPHKGSRGITVLTLLLLIIAVVLGAILLVRYLRSRPAAAQSSQVSLLWYQTAHVIPEGAYLMSRLIS
jgi:hypothetical protein